MEEETVGNQSKWIYMDYDFIKMEVFNASVVWIEKQKAKSKNNKQINNQTHYYKITIIMMLDHRIAQCDTGIVMWYSINSSSLNLLTIRVFNALLKTKA